MTDIYKIAEITKLSLRTLRTLDKHGFLIVTKSASPLLDSIRDNLRRGNPLTALQQLYLLKEPDKLAELAQWGRQIEATLERLGDALGDGAPWDVSGQIELVARRDADATEKVAGWLRDYILFSDNFDNGRAHDHAFIAVRLLANVPDHSLADLAKKAQACLWQCRRMLPDYWRLDESGKTLYFRPKKTVATLDL